MKTFLATLVLTASFSAMAAGKLSLNVELNPAGSFQATSEKMKGEVTKAKDGSVSASKLTVDIKSMKTGIDLRNEHLWKHLNSEKYPQAILSDVKGKDGKATGQLEVAGVKRPVEISYKDNGDSILASFKVKASEFKLPDATYLGVGVEDNVAGEANLPVKTI